MKVHIKKNLRIIIANVSKTFKQSLTKHVKIDFYQSNPGQSKSQLKDIIVFNLYTITTKQLIY